jgi:hypothetical protein
MDMREFDVKLTISLMDGTDQVKTVKMQAPNENGAKEALANLMRGIASTGVMAFDTRAHELVLDPAPAQIRSLRAHLPSIVLAKIIPGRKL